MKRFVSSQLSLWATGVHSPALLTCCMTGLSSLQVTEKAKKCRIWQVEVRLEGTEVVRTKEHSKTLTVSVIIDQTSFEGVVMSVLLGIRLTS